MGRKKRLPQMAGESASAYFRGLLRLHSRYGPPDRSAAQGGLCHKAPAGSVTQTSRLSATRSNRLLSRWNLPPLATRAYGAHWAIARDCSLRVRQITRAVAHGNDPMRDLAHPTHHPRPEASGQSVALDAELTHSDANITVK